MRFGNRRVQRRCHGAQKWVVPSARFADADESGSEVASAHSGLDCGQLFQEPFVVTCTRSKLGERLRDEIGVAKLEPRLEQPKRRPECQPTSVEAKRRP